MPCKIGGIDSGSMDVLYVPANSGLFRERERERERDAQFGLLTGQENSGFSIQWYQIDPMSLKQDLHESIFWTFFNAVWQKKWKNFKFLVLTWAFFGT